MDYKNVTIGLLAILSGLVCKLTGLPVELELMFVFLRA